MDAEACRQVHNTIGTSNIDEAYAEEDVEESKVKWRRLFGDKFGTYDTSIKKAAEAHIGRQGVRNTEETLIGRWNISTRLNAGYRARVTGRLSRRNGFREYELSKYGNVTPANGRMKFRLNHNVPGEVQVYWKVRNMGEEAISNDCIRGQVELDDGTFGRSEPTKYRGKHYVEAYVVQDGVCVAVDRQDVFIK